MPRSPNGKKKVLDTAARLFYKNGYKATGVEAIAQAAGVTKATLYHHFTNKDALIEASLRYLSDFHRQAYVRAWSREDITPLQRLTVLFDEMESWFRDDDFYGCPFINASGEFTDRAHPARRICEQHYQFLISNLAQHARDAGLREPERVAEKLAALIAGAYTGWYVAGLSTAARSGKESAVLVIEEYGKG